MTTATKRTKLVTYLKNASDGKIDLLYSELESELEKTDDDLDDETYIELLKRSKSFLDGTAKTYSMEESRNAALNRLKEMNKSKQKSAIQSIYESN